MMVDAILRSSCITASKGTSPVPGWFIASIVLGSALIVGGIAAYGLVR